MADVILLVHDDISTIATVRRLLVRDGYEVVLTTSVADAIVAFTHHLPSVVLLAPSIEGGRGRFVLDELLEQREGRPASVLLLGESIPGFDLQVVPLPLDGDSFLEVVRAHMHPTVVLEVKEAGLTPPVVPGNPIGPSALAAQAEAAAQAAMELAHQEIEADALATLETALSQALAQLPHATSEEETKETPPNENETQGLKKAKSEDVPTRVQFPNSADDTQRGGTEVLRRIREELARLAQEKDAAQAETGRLAKAIAESEIEARRASARAQELVERERVAQEAALRAEKLSEETRREVERLREELRARTEQNSELAGTQSQAAQTQHLAIGEREAGEIAAQEQYDGVGEAPDIERLEAKFEEVQNGDYFSILDLPRSAGTAEVQRAFGLLSAEFDPLRFALHPDPSLQQRAQHVHDALVEAATVLQDDRLRSQYAVNLLD